MKYLSVCSGIEAATVAWHGLGWAPVAFAEIEAFPAAVLAHHYPTVPNLGDLTKYRDWPDELLAEVELLVGGTPCQAFSVAGQRRSLGDERGNLSLIYVNLFHHINEVRKRHGRPPAIALWENVPGVLSTKDNAFGCFIGGLLGCDEAPATESGKWDKAGFLSSETVRVGYRVLDAQYFGVAQRRRRVFLVAVPCELVERFGERACPSEVLSLRESVLGNPPTRGTAWEGVARDTTACTASRSGCGESIERGSVSGTLTARYSRNGGAANDDIDANRLVAFGGNRSSGPLDVATSVLAHTSPHGSQDFASETFVAFTSDGVIADPISANEARTYTHEGTTFRLHNCVGRSVCATGDRSHALTTRSAVEEDGTGRGTPIVPAIAFTAKDSGGDATNEVSPTMRAMHHINGNANAGGQLAVAFSDSAAAHSYGVAQTVEDTPPLRGGQGGNVIPAVALTKAKRAQSNTDNESWVPGDIAPTQNQFDQGETRATTVVAFTQNSRDEVRLINDDGNLAGALNAEGGMHQTNYLAFANRTRDGIKVPEVMKDGVVPALTNPGGSGRSDAVNVASAMQVRRLTPTECAYLQGFPADYLDITFRKKPAADGPKYRALGNSMAVPCMWWLGLRIDNATRRDIP